MRNQCFWISIQHFLRNNGYPSLRVREIRRIAGLDSKTENVMFDSYIESFRNAAEAVARYYNLTINIFPVNSFGQVLHDGDLFERIGNGINIINIAQFGTYHFQLITSNVDNPAESNFVPAVDINNDIVDINEEVSDINQQKVNIKIFLTDLESEIKNYKKTLESYKTDYLNYKQLNEQLNDSDASTVLENLVLELTVLYQETETKLKKCENDKLSYEYMLNEL